jgi:hypothetical protein
MRFLIIVCTVFCLLLCVAGLASATEFPGPDDFGYTAQNIPFNLRDVSTSGTQVSLKDDEVSDAIPLGFSFNFYGKDYTEVFISSNGFLTFTEDTDPGCCQRLPLPTEDDINNLIAGFWHDLNPRGGGEIRYETLGTEGNKEFVVGFYDVPHYRGPPVTFEMILHEGSNSIELQYASAPTDHTVGIENAEGTIGLQIPVGFLNQGFLFSLQQKNNNIEVPINIDPLSCPNNYLLVSRCYGFSHKWLWVAVSGEGIDVSTIDRSTFKLEGVPPFYSRVKNIYMVEHKTQTSSKSGKEFKYCSFKQHDERVDLLMVFKTSEIVEALESNLGRKLIPGEPLVLTLTGNLDSLNGGNQIVGEDLVIIKEQQRRGHKH